MRLEQDGCQGSRCFLSSVVFQHCFNVILFKQIFILVSVSRFVPTCAGIRTRLMMVMTKYGSIHCMRSPRNQSPSSITGREGFCELRLLCLLSCESTNFGTNLENHHGERWGCDLASSLMTIPLVNDNRPLSLTFRSSSRHLI
jgi:hypothetical protein